MVDGSRTSIGGMRIWLVVTSGETKGTIVEVTDDRFVIGRASECDFVLADPKVSHQHAAIHLRPGKRPELQDLGSSNGTFLNGQPLAPPVGFTMKGAKASAELGHGDLIGFGDTMLVASFVDPAST